MTLHELYEIWIKDKKLRVKMSTVCAYEGLYAKHIFPALGKEDVMTLDRKKLKPFVDSLLERLSRHSTRDVLIVVKNMLKFADEELDMNVPSCTWRYKWPTASREGKKNLERYTVQELKKIVDYLENNPSSRNLGLLIAIGTGLRIGEICGLRWEDVDVGAKTITVNRTIERISKRTEDGTGVKSKLIFSTPKSESSNRTVPLPSSVVQIVKNFSKTVRPDYYVVTSNAKPTEPRTYRNYYKKTVGDILGFDCLLKFHALRHSFASVMIENNVDVKTVSQLLGHSDVSITLDTYVHPTEDQKRKAIKAGLKGIF